MQLILLFNHILVMLANVHFGIANSHSQFRIPKVSTKLIGIINRLVICKMPSIKLTAFLY